MKLSVITINYNNRDGLERTMRSVLCQTFTDYEYIIIDGGSTDGSREVIERYADRLAYWVSEPDRGIYHAMNKGVAAANGEYCLFMNSGDTVYEKDTIERFFGIKATEDVVCGNICVGNGNICPNPDEVTMRTFYKHSLYHQACFIRTSLLKDNPYDEQMRSAADWKWFLHILIFRNGSYRHMPVTIANFEGGGISESNNEIGNGEIKEELSKCLPPRVLSDYEDYCFGHSQYMRMVNQVRQIPKLEHLMYQVDTMILKLVNLKIKSKWIKEL